MSAIGKGDWVECIKVRPPGERPSDGFKVGAVYCVEAVVGNVGCGIHGHGATCGGLHLSGMPRVGVGWAACAFRPIYRPKTDLIKSLLQPAPAEPEGVNA